jgi:hypothetical protein
MIKLLRANVFVWLMLAMCSGLSSSRGGELPLSEAQLKAAFLLNFPKYVEWPPASFAEPSSPIVVAILGDESVANEFETMSNGKSVDGHPIQLVRNPTLAQCLMCHVLFIGLDEGRKTVEIINHLKRASILTVGESEQFTDQGGMINMALRERRVVLEINLNAARQTDLKISSKLMALATVKGGKK